MTRRPPWLRTGLLSLICLTLISVGWWLIGRLLPDELHQQQAAFVQGARDLGSPLLMEGLPHQAFEADLLQSELATKKTIQIGGYPFYAKPLSWTDEDAALITGLLGNRRKLLNRPSAAKACGGFHPDYAVAWQDSKSVTSHAILICFGCQEIEFLTPTGPFSADFDASVKEQLQRILDRYRQQRPM